MKKVVFALLWFFLLNSHALTEASAAAEMPEEIAQALAADASLADQAIVAFALPYPDDCMALTYDAVSQRHTLCRLLQSDGVWTLSFQNSAVLPPLDAGRFTVSMFASEQYTPVHAYGAQEKSHSNTVTLVVHDPEKDYYEITLTMYRVSDASSGSVWRMLDCWNAQTNLLFTYYGDRLIHYTNEGWAEPAYAALEFYGSGQTADASAYAFDAFYSDIRQLIRRYEDDFHAKALRSETLFTTWVHGLSDAKYAVYSAPSDKSYRAANGKACVSGKDWIGVIGKTDDYLLVFYDVSESQTRMGYIRYAGDPLLESVAACVPALRFLNMTDVHTTGHVALCDDPFRWEKPLVTLPDDTPLIVLCEGLGSGRYVQVTYRGKIYRGFMDPELLSNGRTVPAPTTRFAAGDVRFRRAFRACLSPDSSRLRPFESYQGASKPTSPMSF